jgi:2-polyprenyl-3-methyl-5-hydroxy-6-metoxy-1,4-benzoquinol methylase
MSDNCPKCGGPARLGPDTQGRGVFTCVRDVCGHQYPGPARRPPPRKEMQTAGGMNADNFSLLYEAERGHFWFECRNRLIVGLLDKYFPVAQSFMEIGCGTGFVLSAIAASRKWERLCGSELHEKGLAFASTRLNSTVELIQMDARAIPALYSNMDVIGAFDVIEHIPEDEAVLRGIHAALKPGGGLVITVPQHKWLWSHVDDNSHHVRRYSAAEVHSKIQAAGFQLLFSGSYTFTLLPAMIASRFKKPSDTTATSKTEFSLPRPVNNLFHRILDIEVSATLAGYRFWCGGSRVVVAEKR